MGEYKEGVLVCFVWILWRVPCFGSECKFSYAIVEFLAGLAGLNRWISCGSCYFLGNGGSHVMTHVLSLVFGASLLWLPTSRLFLRHELAFMTFLNYVLLVLYGLAISYMFLSYLLRFIRINPRLTTHPRSWWLSPASISLAMTYRISIISFLWRQWPQMCLLLILLWGVFSSFWRMVLTWGLDSIELLVLIIVFKIIFIKLLLVIYLVKFWRIRVLNCLPLYFCRRIRCAIAAVEVVT